MPDFAARFDHETALSGKLAIAFDTARQDAETGRPVNWDQLATDTRNVVSDELLAVYLVIFLLMADEDLLQNRQAVAETSGVRWARGHAGELATTMVGNMRRELIAGADPARVFDPRRGEVLSATEVTRAVTRAETDARRANAGTPPGTQPPIAAKDGFVATWNTREDERVCPVCSPLNERPEEEWVEQFPSGPPAHPNCRCFLTYTPEPSLG